MRKIERESERDSGREIERDRENSWRGKERLRE